VDCSVALQSSAHHHHHHHHNNRQVKDDYMYKCVLAKFSQHGTIRRTLLDTGDALLVEHTSNGTDDWDRTYSERTMWVVWG
jgi:predicted NAD-dependent protein-ADP-ribosyltransferase YbiA (DUF1768 family)